MSNLKSILFSEKSMMNWEELGFLVESDETRRDDFEHFYLIVIYEYNELTLEVVLNTNLNKSRDNSSLINYVANIG